MSSCFSLWLVVKAMPLMLRTQRPLSGNKRPVCSAESHAMTNGHRGSYSSWTTCNVIKCWHAVTDFQCVRFKSRWEDLGKMRSFTHVLMLLLSHDPPSVFLSLFTHLTLTHISRGQGRLCPCHKMSSPSQTHKITPRRRDRPGLVSVCHSSVTLAVRTHLSARHVDRLNTCTSHIQQHACLLNRKCFPACKHCIVIVLY